MTVAAHDRQQRPTTLMRRTRGGCCQRWCAAMRCGKGRRLTIRFAQSRISLPIQRNTCATKAGQHWAGEAGQDWVYRGWKQRQSWAPAQRPQNPRTGSWLPPVVPCHLLASPSRPASSLLPTSSPAEQNELHCMHSSSMMSQSYVRQPRTS